MTRRAIREEGSTVVRRTIAKAIGVEPGRVHFSWEGGAGVRWISIAAAEDDDAPRGLCAPEIVALAAVGIHPGADGWEIEEAPANARPPLPPGFGWYEHGHESYGLDVAAVNGRTVAKVRRCTNGNGWSWTCETPGGGWQWADSLPGAKSAAEDACRAAGLFDAPTAPDLGAKVDALHDAAGAPPTGAARTLMTLLLRATSLGEMPGTRPTLAERLDAMGRLCEAFAAELRASLPAPPMPAPRTTDGALTAYLLEHYREAWRPGEDALALAIRLLGAAKTAAGLADGTAALHASRMREVEAERDEARKEAEAADENAKELAAELTRLRAALARETERRIEAERGRGEALGDLATVRNDVLKTAADLAAKMGAPHG